MRYEDLPPKPALARYLAVLNQRARAIGAEGKITLSELRDVILSSHGCCEWCGTSLVDSEFEIDHIHPLKRGGAHQRSNLALSCPTCNRMKAQKTPLVFALERIAAGKQTALISRILTAAEANTQPVVQRRLAEEPGQ